jgi:hypothetical protein
MAVTSELPYVVNPDGTVPAIRKIYRIKDGREAGFDIPLPKGPDEGWPEGGFDRYMKELEQKSQPMIRSAIKKQFGTTKYRFVREERVNLPYEFIARVDAASSWNRKKGHQA